MTGFSSTPKLDCNEQHFRFPGPRDGLPLFQRFLPATRTGTISEIVKAWHGQLAYDPARVAAPVAIIRGEWDSLMRGDDAAPAIGGV
jgi:hypothetical protein